MVVALLVLLAGSVLFHVLSPWYFTDIASNWSAIDDTVAITFWVTGAVFVAVTVFLAYAILRFRHRDGARAAYEPENKKLEWGLLAATTVGVAAMLAPGLFVWAKFVDVPEDAAVVEAMGQQWTWKYRFPGADGKLGMTDPKLVGAANPFGIVPDDPSGKDDVLVDDPELHLPVGRPVKMLLRSTDVLHNFTVAQIRVKMDLVPGLVTHMWFTPTRAGTFDLLCEELCGIAHFAMRGRLVVEDEPAFRRWLEARPTFAQASARSGGDAEAGRAQYAVCAACHGAQGEGNPALNAPKLAGLPAWYTARQLHRFRTGARGAHEKDAFGKMMAPMAAALPDDAAVANVSAYVASLSAQPAQTTVRGDVASGRQRYATCAACHGALGQGLQATNAPALKGMNDWYLVTQLRNFRDGVRGSHPADLQGAQMGLVAGMLKDDRVISDIVAYIGTL